MSGGVDSSTAAALLLQQDFEVIGLTLQMYPQKTSLPLAGRASEPRGLADARAVCQHLGIEFVALDCASAFQREVVNAFASEYRAGRTPNPCVLCNRNIKFAALTATAGRLGIAHIATGHYARIEHHTGTGRHLIRRAQDTKQDQSYFLFALAQEQLAGALFPLGNMTKAEVRAFARAHGLPTADREQSQEICFVPDNDYGRFLCESGFVRPHGGEIVNRQGRVLGCHDGIEFFTVGQRRGLRIAAPRPLHVLELDPVRNQVIVGEAECLWRDEFRVERCNWIAFPEAPPTFDALAKIRYQHTAAPATVQCLPDNTVHVHLHEPQRAVTPGQACVFYQNDLLLGGGWIA